MPKNLSKKNLIDEIAEQTGLNKKDVGAVVDNLRDISYREAHKGFTIPGICKLKVVRKKASKFRNPATGQLMLIDEHDILKAVPLKKAKDAVAPKSEDLIHPLEEENASTDKAAGSAGDSRYDTTTQDSEKELVLFCCPVCGQELEAPAYMKGQEAGCPTCQNNIVVEDRPIQKDHETSETYGDDKGDGKDEGQGDEKRPEEFTNTVKIDLSSFGLS